jgi:ubiquinone/menaquinone biosynthesis C-methylase UbiE
MQPGRDVAADLNEVLVGLRAAAEPTRLRLLVLCAQSELTVSELTQILGQSQPRVSRHLKLMCDAGLLDRFREGTWVFYRLAQRGGGADLGTRLLGLLPAGDPVLALDLERLEAVKRARAESAAAYFRDNAAEWDRIRSLHIDDCEVERVLAERLDGRPLDDFLDIGTGTGRLLELFAPRAKHAVGIDLSREMLAIARANLEQAGLRHVSVRQADLYQLPLPGASFDVVTMHQVLHYLEDPAAAVAEAARVVRPGGVLIIVDFAPHEREELRERHAHRRLGFRESEVAGWCSQAGLGPVSATLLPGKTLTVAIWSAERPGAKPARAPRRASEAVR